MASIKNILFLFAILVSSTLVLAQSPGSNNSSSDEPPSDPPHNGGGSSEEPPQPSSAPGMFDHFPFRVPKFDWPQIPAAGFFNSESRHKRAVGRTVIDCNYSRQTASTCTGCHSVRHCYSMNKGTEFTCSGLFQYCNNGQCSRTKGPLCSDTTSTSSTSSSSSSSSSSTSTSSSTTEKGTTT